MISSRVCCLLFITTLLLVQSGPVTLSHQPPPSSNLQNAVSQPDPAARDRIVQSYGKLPLSFEANQGQTDAQVRFLSRGPGYTLFLTGDEAVFSFGGSKVKDGAPAINRQVRPSPPASNAVLRMKLVKANAAAEPTGEDQLPGQTNYFVGNDSKKWHSNVPTYANVKYEGVYPGIDLVYYGNQRQFEYDFIVAPGADPRRIQFDVRGASKITRDERGDLVLQMGEGKVRWQRPVVYQEKDGVRQEIAANYTVKDDHCVEFAVADYDSRKALFIDPLIYSTYLGGSGDDYGVGIAVDSSGNAYVTGRSLGDAFVAKFNPTGSALVYSTYLGGSGGAIGNGIAVDSAGNAYVVGMTNSTDFPVVNPLQAANGGGYDAFVAKINPAGSALIYSTYLGGSKVENGHGIATDSLGNAYVTGETDSTNFPIANALQPASGGGYDAFVAKINPTGSAFIYSTYLGGDSDEVGYGIAVHSGSAYVTGYTISTNFPTVNPLQAANGGGIDAFVAKFSPTGSALVYSTYLGGSSGESAFGIAADSFGNAYVTGETSSSNFPTLNPLQRTRRGGYDAFVTKINSSGSALVYSTYLGGSADDYGYGIAADVGGSAYVTGITLSTNFRTVKPLQAVSGGSGDAFVAKINPTGSALAYSTYLGGSGLDYGNGIAQHGGNAYVTGITASTNFPTMNPLQPANGGNADAFITVISKPAP